MTEKMTVDDKPDAENQPVADAVVNGQRKRRPLTVHLDAMFDRLLVQGVQNIEAGLVGSITEVWKVGLTLSGFYYPVFQEHSRLQAVLSQNFRVSRNNSIAVSLKGERTFGYERYEVKVGWNVYF